MRQSRQLLVVGASTAGTCLIALTIPIYFVYLATTAVIFTLLARSVGTVTGQAGMISLCQMTFCAIGAWVTDWLNINLPHAPFLIQLVAGSLASLGCGFLIGLPALRLRGINLAAVTLAFAVALDAVLTTVGFPGNEAVVIFQRPIWLVDDSMFLVFCIVLAGAVLLALGVMRKTPLGGSWSAVKFSERACASLGISVAAAKLAAFSASAGIAGLAGGLLIAQLGTVTARNFDPLSSLVVFALGVFTGAQFAEGAILAGALTVAIPELLRRFGLPLDLDALIFAVGAIDALRRGGGVAEGLRAKLTSHLSTTDNSRGLSRLEDLRGGVVPRPDSGRPADVSQQLSLGINPSVALLVPEVPFRDGLTATAGREITLTAPELGRVVPFVRKPVLQIDGLTVRYGEIVALHKLSMRIEDTSVTALIGPNGAGKSTLVDTVSGFIQPSEGRIWSAGAMLNGLPAHRRARVGIRRTFQQCRAIPELRVGEFIRLAGRGLTDTYVNEIVEFFDCPAQSTIIADVEVGLRRVVEVAAAVAARPRLLLLDEPAAGLSSGQSRRLGDRIAAIPRRFGCAIVLIEHDMELVRSACDTVIVLDFGHMIACGSPGDVLGRPEVAAAYLGVVEP